MIRAASLAVVAAAALAGSAVLGLWLIDQAASFRDYLSDGVGLSGRTCAQPFCDYALFWHAGRMAAAGAGASVYDTSQFFAATGQTVKAYGVGMPFMYPPVTLLFLAVAAMTPLALSYYGFAAFSVIFAAVLLRVAGLAWGCILLGLAGLPALWCLDLGQFGVICGALLICGLALIETRPWAAGAVLACLCIKPHYALLIPVVVLARRDGRVAAAGSLALAALAGASVAYFGWQVWVAFFAAGGAEARVVLQAPFGTGYEVSGASVFWLVRSLGGGCFVADAVQLAASALALAGTYEVWRRDAADPKARLALTVLLALLASPYEYTDDLVGYSAVLPMLARQDRPAMNAALAVLWFAPALAMRFTRHARFLPLPFCIAAAASMAWGCAFRTQALAETRAAGALMSG